MKTRIVVFLIFCLATRLNSQTCYDAAVLLNATVTSNPSTITLHWPTPTASAGIIVYRKTPAAFSWGTPLVNLVGIISSYTDTAVVDDSLYEYKVSKTENGIQAYGYLLSGIHYRADDVHGYMAMLVDSSVADSLSSELNQLMKDLSGDGWALIRHDVNRNGSVDAIKNLLIADYLTYPNLKSVIIIGHVPVPYSGDLNPDGHPDHLGAWPADVYYGEMNGVWTDNAVNDTLAGRIENRNKPGDGKFDQTFIPGNAELQVGRIDLSNMPSFPQSEIQLLRQYLQKDHAYKTKMFSPSVRGLVDDNFGYFGGEAFAASGWRSMAPLVGDSSIEQIDFFTTLQDSSYLWSYGCGGGWFQGSGGVGSTTDFVNDTVQTVFTELFGSYFGDWDSQDNFLRAPLAGKSQALSCVWSGRPYWQFHPMAMGKSLGYCTLLTQNNSNTYWANYAMHWVHIALMGDPSLRMNMIAPPTQVQTTTPIPGSVLINWTASVDSVLGYYVYRSNELFGVYERISPSIVINNSFVDSSPVNGNNFYQVRAVKLQQGFSGTYYNTSIGTTDTLSQFFNSSAVIANDFSFQVFPNPTSQLLQVKCNDELGTEETISVFSSAGILLFQKKYFQQNQTITIPVSDFASGIYFISLCNKRISEFQKFEIEK